MADEKSAAPAKLKFYTVAEGRVVSKATGKVVEADAGSDIQLDAATAAKLLKSGVITERGQYRAAPVPAAAIDAANAEAARIIAEATAEAERIRAAAAAGGAS